MANNASKTNVTRLLAQRKIAFEALTYPDTLHSAEEVAEALHKPLHQVFKTLVVLREKGKPLLVVAPGGKQLDLRRLAAAIGEKKLRMATQREAEELTGLLVGGISALALLHKGFDVYIDDSACGLEDLCVSGGQRGLNIHLSVADFRRLTGAKPVPATED